MLSSDSSKPIGSTNVGLSRMAGPCEPGSIVDNRTGADRLMRSLFSFGALLALAAPLALVPPPIAAGFAASAQAGSVICQSKSNGYNECFAGKWSEPVMIRQLSRTQCVEEENWGYNRKTKYVWVGSGCSGEFADGGPGGAAGCHGTGCLVDRPTETPTPPPPTRDLSVDGIDRCATAAVAKARSMGHNPRVNRIVDQYPDRDGYHVEGEIRVTRSDGDFDMQFLCLWNGDSATVMFGSGL